MFQVFINGEHFGEFSRTETSIDDLYYMLETNGFEVLDCYEDPEFGDVQMTCLLDE